MSWDESVNAKMYQTDAESLCTLCELENRADVFENFSSSLSLDTQIFSSFDIGKKIPADLPEINNVTAGINYLPSHRESFNKIEENVIPDNEVIDSIKNQCERNEKFQWKPRNRADNDKNGSQYPRKTIEHKKSLDQLSCQNKDQEVQQTLHEQQSTIPSFSEMSQSISFEIGILPELSQTIIDHVFTLVDKNLIESTKNIGIPSKFDKLSKEQPQVSFFFSCFITYFICKYLNIL